MGALSLRTTPFRRGLALGLGAILLFACGDSAVHPADDDDDSTSSSSSGGTSSGRSSSSSSGRNGSSSSSSTGGSSSSSSGSSTSSSSSGSSSSSSSSSGELPLFELRGTVSGYQGSGLILSTGNRNLTVAAGATSWVFAEGFATDDDYNVQVAAQPANPTQVCTVTNPSGTFDGEDVDDVQVTCATTAEHVVRVTTTGLVGSVTLQNNGGDTLVVNGASASFATPLASGAAYNVTVSANPPNQTCTVSNGSGLIGAADVTVQVTCVTNNGPTATLGGLAFGVAGPGLVLANAGEQLAVDAEQEFEFVNPVAVGANYDVTVVSSPPGQTCTVVDGGQGVMVDGGVDDVLVECVAATYPLKVTVAGLEGDSVTLKVNNVDRVVNANGSSSTNLANGAAYAVTVVRHPLRPAQTCTMANGAGTINGAPVEVVVTCVTDCAQLVINEVQRAGANSNHKFAEIFNKGTCEVNFNKYRLIYRSAGGGIGANVTADFVVAPGGYMVFGTSTLPTPRDATIANNTIGADGQLGIVLVDNVNEIVDSVAWGNVANGVYTESAVASSPAASKTISRIPNGTDTNNNSADFQVRNPTPRAAN